MNLQLSNRRYLIAVPLLFLVTAIVVLITIILINIFKIPRTISSSFEMIAFIPYSEEGLHDQIVFTSKALPSGGDMLGRTTSKLLRASDGTLWLLSDGKILRIDSNNSATPFSLAAAKMDKVISVAPVSDKGLMIFGSRGNSVVLVRLNSAGEVVWEKTDLSTSPQNSIYLKFMLDSSGSVRMLPFSTNGSKVDSLIPIVDLTLLADTDGSVYLYSTDEEQLAQIAQVDLANGAVTKKVDFTGYMPKDVWVQQGRLYWVNYNKENGLRSWESQDIATGNRNTVTPTIFLQPFMVNVRAPLSNGGALLSDLGGELAWIGPDGADSGHLKLGNLVRTGNEGELAVAIKDNNQIHLARWNKGQKISSLDIEPVSDKMGLIYADQNKYYLIDSSERIIAVDQTGKQEIVSASEDTTNKFKLLNQGGASVREVIAEPNGSLLFTGADAKGVYVIRLTTN